MTRFSICIPNFNYADYLGETIRSALDQDDVEVEVLVADNASTDGSVAVVEAIDDPRLHLTVNACNVGFAANLDRACAGATGDVQILLSSDDLVRPGALRRYGAMFDALGSEPTLVTSVMDVVDASGATIGRLDGEQAVWKDAPIDDALSTAAGCVVRSLPASDALRRSLRTMRNPCNFAATAYQRTVYDAVEGYGGGRLLNPDKWFHWRALAVASRAVLVTEPLFAYRWHASNQTAQQTKQGALKLLVDDYTSTFEITDEALAVAGMRRSEVIEAFVEHDIARHGLATLARGDRVKAARILAFGRACYPDAVRRSRRAGALRALLAARGIGQRVAARAHAASSAHRDGWQ